MTKNGTPRILCLTAFLLLWGPALAVPCYWLLPGVAKVVGSFVLLAWLAGINYVVRSDERSSQ